VSPILGVIASANQSQFISTNSYESIATTTVGAGGASTVTFSSIPSTYQHLQVRILARGTNAATEIYIIPQINGVTGNNYTQHMLYGDGSTVTAQGSTADIAVIQRFAGANATSGIFGTAIVDFLDYTNSNKKPVMRSLGGVDRNGGGIIGFTSTMIQTNGAITQLSFAPNAANFAQYSSFALYGIKG
jgi:hypothetical protein